MFQAKNLLKDERYPHDLKHLPISALPSVASQVRYEMICAVSKTGGHLGPGLGVVELTVALHYVFDAPHDQIIWDIGHQAYPHKILTGRLPQMYSLRQPGGLSGFLRREESIYDVFGAGHSSTSISAALGIATGYQAFKNDHRNIVAIIGDSAIGAGMAYEAINHAAAIETKLLIILNDNAMSISPTVGGLKNLLDKLSIYTSYNIFESCQYIGPVDGHDISQLIPILQAFKDDKSRKGPTILHIKTQKGKGFHSPEASNEAYHSVNKYDLDTLAQHKSSSSPTFTSIFANTIINIAKSDDNVVCITAAMPSGTGLAKFAEHYPTRMFDVGIAEQHAATFAAGLSLSGIKPFFAVYSTFLQRAYDQVIHDIAIQNLPVRFIIDRAGFVGADGATHAGSFDLTYLCNLPNFVVMAPSSAEELEKMVIFASDYDAGPIAVRFPRGEAVSDQEFGIPEDLQQTMEIGKGRTVYHAKGKAQIVILSLGCRLAEALKAGKILSARGIGVTVYDARFAKPLDTEQILHFAQHSDAMVTVESGASGGFGSRIASLLLDNGMLDNGKLRFRQLHMADTFVEHNHVEIMYEEAGLCASNIINTALLLLQNS
jgi:1-deoxy-D-xylulose-5-phosphate synthase